MSKKYELTSETTQTINGETLYRIKALRDFGNIRAGNLGGFIGAERNLSQENSCWVSGDARVSGNARVFGDAQIYGNAWVYGNAQVYGNTWISGDARVFGNARVFGDAQIYGNAWVCGNAQVSGDARVSGNTWISGNTRVFGDAQIYGNARVSKPDHIITFSGFGRGSRTTTAFKTELSFSISCGCFSGTLEEFRAAISETHGDNKFGREYKLITDLIELHFSEE